MRRRLFERFQQRVERFLGEHVHLVDDVDLVTAFRRRVAHVVAQLAHVIDTAVARAIDLDHVEAVARGDLRAVIALSAWRDRRAVDAIERLCQNSRSRSFADAPRPDEQIRVSQAVLYDRIFKRARDMRLPHQIVESLRPIFSGKYLVTHTLNLNALIDASKQKSLDHE